MHGATRSPHRLTFICEPDDPASVEAALTTGERTLLNRYPASYSNAIQTAYERSHEPFFLAANDDFHFNEGWDEPALECLDRTGAAVVALNDGSPSPERMQKIALVRRSYIEERSGVVDMPGRVFYPYEHNYVDTEFYWTAVSRGVLLACEGSIIEHRHPCWGHVRQDDTYWRGQESLGRDGNRYNERAHLWNGG